MLLIESTHITESSIHGLETEEHGGNCCGVMHLHSFPCSTHHDRLRNISVDQRITWIKRAVGDCIDSYSHNWDDEDDDYEGQDASNWVMCVDVCLAGYQLADWREPLEAVGFKEVTTFTNSNSSNDVHIFHFVTCGVPE